MVQRTNSMWGSQKTSVGVWGHLVGAPTWAHGRLRLQRKDELKEACQVFTVPFTLFCVFRVEVPLGDGNEAKH